MSHWHPLNCRPVLLCFLHFLYFLCLLFFPFSLQAQQPPVDAAEISRDLLYHPARAIETRGGGIVFRAAQFSYALDTASGQWRVTRELNDLPPASLKIYRSDRLGLELRFSGDATDNEGILEIRAAGSDSPHRIPLWSRTQLAGAWVARQREESPGLTEDRFARELDIADPEVAAVADDGTYLWLAIRHDDSENYFGIGSLVCLDPKTNETQIFQPPELATSSITHMVLANGALWLGVSRQVDAGTEPTLGLVRFDPATGRLRAYRPGASSLVGSVVTALGGLGETLFVATDAGMCRVALPAEQWSCWRIVPRLELAAPVPVSNRSGGKSGGNLAPGSYEVRWANVAFLEVVTSDFIEGWISTDDFQDYAQRNFDAAPYELGNPSAGGASSMRLLDRPEGDPLAGAIVYRAALERAPTKPGEKPPEGWVRVRAWVGWIPRGTLEVLSVVEPVK